MKIKRIFILCAVVFVLLPCCAFADSFAYYAASMNRIEPFFMEGSPVGEQVYANQILEGSKLEKVWISSPRMQSVRTYHYYEDKVVSISDGTGRPKTHSETTYVYGVQGNTLVEYIGRTKKQEYSFDNDGNLVRQIFVISYMNEYLIEAQYDANKNLVLLRESQNGRHAHVYTYEYDQKNRLVKGSEGASVQFVITYDDDKNTAKLVSYTANSTYSLRFDARGNVLRADYTLAGKSTAFKYYENGYDSMGRLTRTRFFMEKDNYPGGYDLWEEKQYTYGRSNEMSVQAYLDCGIDVDTYGVSDEVPATGDSSNVALYAALALLALVCGAVVLFRRRV